MKEGRDIVKTINIDLFEDELSYILTGLELFSLNLNNKGCYHIQVILINMYKLKCQNLKINLKI